ncbi:replicative DNA helicase [Candidatus Phytoplasma luffae]|uniref:Replicative DNA helicase n=1 Tax=Loofah witches'-broom phytoplasma TaxID=35773 RepID=A0A975FJQ1_LOWBP|nr:DnaB-like helicase C-terminal domain-containing protein [Candidatus Phytoplasma luffae]QTX02613.1 replicative DNA helicase [Candidatus Phytoplasma luffae]QTX02639.1 replicative DNA helicase [Candidatus Phytoplasma luffae]QTX02716.1 replicative DNA helicase [Candidatus Phytoplasma luffae]QTX02877.1 replicative DNA helicase [Candidatus Phytoplasma luffae]QTX02899.1 replicative DNA helicase [Candidatus Phytoplasma luffae]
MLTNEHQALIQIINYIEKGEWNKLKLYCQIINPKYLTKSNHQKIYNALKYLYLEKKSTHPWDKIKTKETIIKELLTYLQTHYPQENFNNESLMFLNNNNIHNEHLLENLKHTYTQETLFQQLIKTINPSFDNQDLYHKHLYYQEIFDKLRNFINLIPNKKDKTLLTLNQMTKLYPEVFETDNISKQKIQEEYYRLSDTFKGLNQATKGFKKGQIITIGGYTGLGKTSFIYNLLLDLAKTKYQENQHYPYMLVFSFEMTSEENLNRLLSNQTQIPLDVILDKNFDNITQQHYTKKMIQAKQFFTNINLSFSYDQEKNINYIVDLLYRLHLESKIEIVVIDHLQITKASNKMDNDRLAIDEIMTKIKEIAIELKIVIIILSQFSRDTYSNYNGKSPEITALKGSGGIETNSDIVLIMSEFNPNIKKNTTKPLNIYTSTLNQLYLEADDNDNQKIIEVNIKKNRSGTKKTLVYHFKMTTQTFQEVGYVLPYQIEDF